MSKLSLQDGGIGDGGFAIMQSFLACGMVLLNPKSVLMELN